MRVVAIFWFLQNLHHLTTGLMINFACESHDEFPACMIENWTVVGRGYFLHPSSRSENVASACRVVKTRQQISIGTAGKSALKVENLSSYTLLKGHTLKESKDIAPQGGKFTDICMVGRAVTPPHLQVRKGWQMMSYCMVIFMRSFVQKIHVLIDSDWQNSSYIFSHIIA